MGVFPTIIKRLGPLEKPIQFPFEWEFWPLDCAQQIGTLVVVIVKWYFPHFDVSNMAEMVKILITVNGIGSSRLDY